VADWGDGVPASCTVSPIVRIARAVDGHNVLRYHWLMPISCHFRDCKALLVASLSGISSAQTFAFTFIFTLTGCQTYSHFRRSSVCHFLSVSTETMRPINCASIEWDIARARTYSLFFRRTLLRYVRLTARAVRLSVVCL